MSHHFLVTEDLNGKRLDQAVSVLLAKDTHTASLSVSRSQVLNWIKLGLIELNAVKAMKPGQTLKTGDQLLVQIPETKKLDLTPVDLKLEILFEDEHLALINKPAGISVHPSDTDDAPTLVHGLLFGLNSLSSIGSVERPGIVHRIDKGTSGVLVITKTDQAHQGLAKQFADHSIERRYVALVCGDLAQKQGVSGKIETLFGRHPSQRKKMTGRIKASAKSKNAITHWKVLESFSVDKSLSLTKVECKLETGRTHQIRVHLSELGFPLLGDPIYKPQVSWVQALVKSRPELAGPLAKLDHQLLHAESLGFVHPITQEKKSFKTPLPADFLEILDLLK